LEELKTVTKSPEETFGFGERLAATLKAADVLLLTGELGSGKTTLIQGITSGLGIKQQITSPAFKLLSIYYGRLELYHFDLWRLSRLKDIEDIGITDYLYSGNGVVVIEWAEKVRSLWPPERIEIYLSILNENEREIVVKRVTGNDTETSESSGN